MIHADRREPAVQSTIDPYRAVRAELTALRHRVTGVQGCVIAGVDGLMILHDTMPGAEPHDIATLAAGAHGISRTCAAALHQGAPRGALRQRTGWVSAAGELSGRPWAAAARRASGSHRAASTG
jgi:uncharacterized protein